MSQHWFGEPSVGWSVTRLKNIVASTKTGAWGDDPKGSEDDIRCVRVADFDRPHLSLGDVSTLRSITSKDRADRLLKRGDLLLEKSGGTDTNPVGFTVIFDEDFEAISSNFITRLRLHSQHDSRFWLYALAASYSTKRTQRSVRRTTGIQNLDYSTFMNEEFPAPQLIQQRAIADFLDRETTRIDTLIEEQQGLIEMLAYRRAAVIRAALTGGIASDNGKFAMSTEYGYYPADWSVVPTRHLCTITTGVEDSGNATVNGEYPFYVRGRQVLRIGSYGFDGEAVMTPGDGQGGTGKVFHYYNGKFQAHQRVYVFINFDGIRARYFYYFLSTFLRDVALAGSNTVTMESLRRPLLANFKVLVPPLYEQDEIIADIEQSECESIELIDSTRRFIELAQERRAALITAAVTGQIDARQVAV